MKSTLHLYYVLITCLFLFCASIQNTFASHLVGSDITYKCTPTPGIFEVTLVLYRQCNGGAASFCQNTCGAPCTQTIYLSGADPNCTLGAFTSITVNLVSVRDVNMNNNCPGAKNTCDNMGCVIPGTYTPAVERFEFIGYANIGASSGIPTSCCNVRLSYTFCCRSSDILTGPANANFYTDAIVNRCLSVTPCNSSPVLTNDPFMIVCGGENVVLNNGAIDPDMDSLSYRFVPALEDFGSPVSYLPPYTFDKPMPWTGNENSPFPGGIHCDPHTGDIRFTPPVQNGLFTGVVAVEIKQWKMVNVNGTPKMTVIGTTRRDFQMMVRNDCLPNNPPRFTTNPSAPSSNHMPLTQVEICAGQQFCFTATALDTDFNPPTLSDTTYLSWNAALATFGATFKPDYDPIKRMLPDTLGGGPREDRYQFCWTPADSMASSTPYYFTMSAKDTHCPNPGRTTTAFSIKVSPKAAITIQRNIDTCGLLHVSFTNNTPTVQIGTYIWDISPVNNPQKHFYYTNQKPVTHPIRDTGLYAIRLVLLPGVNGLYTCSSVAIDSIRATRTSLIDSLEIGHPTCSYSRNGFIAVFAINGIQPYQYAFNQGAYSANHSFTSLVKGKHTVWLKDASGCSIERQVELVGNNLIEHTMGNIHVYSGDTQLYWASYKPHATAIWSVSNGTILSGQNTPHIVVKWSSTGAGTVKLIVSDSICSDTSILNITIGNVGITNIQNPMGIKMYPNPTQSILNIQATRVTADTRIEVYNVLGKLVMEKELTQHQQLNLELFPNGLYFVKIGDWNMPVVKE